MWREVRFFLRCWKRGKGTIRGVFTPDNLLYSFLKFPHNEYETLSTCVRLWNKAIAVDSILLLILRKWHFHFCMLLTFACIVEQIVLVDLVLEIFVIQYIFVWSCWKHYTMFRITFFKLKEFLIHRWRFKIVTFV